MRAKASFLIITLLLASLANTSVPQPASPRLRLHRGTFDAARVTPPAPASVSYTHLTLPTIYSV